MARGNNEKADAVFFFLRKQCIFSFLLWKIYLFSIALTSANENYSSFSIQNTYFVIVNFKTFFEIEENEKGEV